MSRRLAEFALAALAALVLAPSAHATPVATNEQERDLYGRVFPEPIRSVDFINHGPRGGPSELADGFRLLEKRGPGFVEFTTIDRELGDPNAFSVGPDGKPPWDVADSGDGLPFYVAKVTDESVPDAGKGYVLLLNAHPAEPCGQEGSPRFLEDLLIWRQTDPGHVLDDGTGLYGGEHRITVAELLKKVKIYFVSVSPDDWSGGDGPANDPDNYNYAGFNENRVAFQDGWVFPSDPALFERGYSTMTQPEGVAATRYLRGVRERELGGRPFAVANDQHGPLPSSGAIILHDQGNDPAKLDRTHDYAQRLADNMDEVFARYFTGAGLNASQQAALQAGDLRDLLLRKYVELTGQPVEEKAAYLTLEWAEYATAWDHLDYTVVGSYGGWAGSRSGLEADSISFETACEAVSGRWNPALFQLFVDNVRAADETGVVHAAQQAGAATPRPATTYDLHGRVGFVETGRRITDADGNHGRPPRGHPGTPLYPQVEQAHYDVSNTDYFRDLDRVVRTPVVEVPARRVARDSRRVDSLVVADTDEVDVAALRRFASDGGNLVLTDSALRLLPALVDIRADAVRQGFAYVGYTDLDRTHPWTEGLYKRARQMYDPVGLGYPLLMERDQYWPCSPQCDVSPTYNSAPIWTVDRGAWDGAGGTTIGTADPPADRKFGGEGTKTDKSTIGTLPFGKGRIVVFGALLPQATESFDHWFGLDPYTISISGQQLLLRALSWDDGRRAPTSGSARPCRQRVVLRLPRSVRGERVTRGRVTVGGKRVRLRRVRGRLVASIDLRRRQAGTLRVRVVSITRGGRRHSQVRRVRACVVQHVR